MTEPALRLVVVNDEPDTRVAVLEAALVPLDLTLPARGAYLALLGMVDGLAELAPLWVPEQWLLDYFRGIPAERLAAALEELLRAGLIVREHNPPAMARVLDFDPARPVAFVAPHPALEHLLPRRRRGRV